MIVGAEWLVWIIPLLAVPVVPVIGTLSPRLRNYFAVVVAFVAAGLSVSLFLDQPAAYEVSWPWLAAYGFQVQVRVDGLAIFLALIVNLLGALIVLYSLGYMGQQSGLNRYYALILLFIGSMTGLVLSGNFLQLYIFWELVGICSSFLIAFWYDRPEAVRAGLKAFLVTRVGDIGLLVGLVYLYVNTGAINFIELERLASQGAIPLTILTSAGLLMFSGAIGKSAQFPLHVWLPDAMEGPTTVSALIHAATMVNAGVYLVARTFPIFAQSPLWLSFVGTIGIVSALLAASMAMATFDLKRVLAYSTISQLGLMFAALGLGTQLGWFASQFHLMSQGVFKALGFLAAGSVIHALGTRDMNQMGGLRKNMPFTFFAFLFSSLALVGIPPFIGFWSKDLILTSMLGVGSVGLFLLVLVVTVMTSFYAFRAMFKVFIVPPKPEFNSRNVHESPAIMLAPLMVLSAAVLFLFPVEPNVGDLLQVHVEAGIEGLVVVLSLVAAAVGLAICSVVYSGTAIRASELAARYGFIRYAQRMLTEGYGFDRLYELVVVRPLQFAGQTLRSAQTGILGINFWAVILLLTVLVLVILR